MFYDLKLDYKMGKKDPFGSRKRSREAKTGEEEENLADDLELQAELAALKAIRASQDEEADIIEEIERTQNSTVLKRCIENFSTASMPFIETLIVDQVNLDVSDENDDLKREVTIIEIFMELYP